MPQIKKNNQKFGAKFLTIVFNTVGSILRNDRFLSEKF